MASYKIYSKFCLPCIAEKELKAVQQWALSTFGSTIEVVRTTYRPKLQEEANKIFGGVNYLAFIASFDDKGNVVNAQDFWDFADLIKGNNMEQSKAAGFMTQAKKKPAKVAKKKAK